LLPRRHNRTAVDRLAYGCMGLSDDGVSVLLHQTLIRGSAALARKPRRLWDKRPTPKKLILTPTPALQNARLGLTARPRSVAARVDGSHAAVGQMRPPGIFKRRSVCRGPIQASGSGASASAWGSGLAVPPSPHARHARPHGAPVRPPAPRHTPVFAGGG